MLHWLFAQLLFAWEKFPRFMLLDFPSHYKKNASWISSLPRQDDNWSAKRKLVSKVRQCSGIKESGNRIHFNCSRFVFTFYNLFLIQDWLLWLFSGWFARFKFLWDEVLWSDISNFRFPNMSVRLERDGWRHRLDEILTPAVDAGGVTGAVTLRRRRRRRFRWQRRRQVGFALVDDENRRRSDHHPVSLRILIRHRIFWVRIRQRMPRRVENGSASAGRIRRNPLNSEQSQNPFPVLDDVLLQHGCRKIGLNGFVGCRRWMLFHRRCRQRPKMPDCQFELK